MCLDIFYINPKKGQADVIHTIKIIAYSYQKKKCELKPICLAFGTPDKSGDQKGSLKK